MAIVSSSSSSRGSAALRVAGRRGTPRRDRRGRPVSSTRTTSTPARSSRRERAGRASRRRRGSARRSGRGCSRPRRALSRVLIGDEDAAGGGHGEVRLEHRRDVRAEERHAVALARAPARAGRSAQPPATGGQIGVAVPPRSRGRPPCARGRRAPPRRRKLSGVSSVRWTGRVTARLPAAAAAGSPRAARSPSGAPRRGRRRSGTGAPRSM